MEMSIEVKVILSVHFTLKYSGSTQDPRNDIEIDKMKVLHSFLTASWILPRQIVCSKRKALEYEDPIT